MELPAFLEMLNRDLKPRAAKLFLAAYHDPGPLPRQFWAIRSGMLAQHVAEAINDLRKERAAVIERVSEGAGYVFIVTRDRQASQSLGYVQHPEWSPDGRLIAVDGIQTMDTAGNGRQQLPGTQSGDERPAWQPLQPPPPPAPGYPRPRGATPLVVPLVPAFEQCTSGQNDTHGAPLAFASCKPPRQSSVYLTTGTPDANGQKAAMAGFVRFDAILGDTSTGASEADVAISARLTDVRCRLGGSPWCTQDAPLASYLGEIEPIATLQMTDRDSAGTVSDPVTMPPTSPLASPFPFVVQCAPTGDPTVGSTCDGKTTVNAITPGAVKEKERAVWELGTVQVFDGGNDGAAITKDFNRVFADQGLFVP